MLVLSRKANEEVVITTASGERIVVAVVYLDRGKVRLGFKAENSVRIDRLEVDERRKGKQ